MDNGIIVGQIINAVIRNIYIAVDWSLSALPDFRVIHNMPSAHCWMPNMNGIDAKGICAGFLTFISVATPIADITALPAKLASAEKHIEAFRVTDIFVSIISGSVSIEKFITLSQRFILSSRLFKHLFTINVSPLYSFSSSLISIFYLHNLIMFFQTHKPMCKQITSLGNEGLFYYLTCPQKTIPDIISLKGEINGQK
jgi:hypothetical protein